MTKATGAAKASREEWTRVFLRMLRATANIRQSCDAAGIQRSTAYRFREANEAFAAEWDEAVDDAIDELVKVARERALAGSDDLMKFLLAAARPHIFSRRHQELRLTSDIASPVKFTISLREHDDDGDIIDAEPVRVLPPGETA